MQPIICFGEILWDLLPGGKQPGGAPMNVAFHLNRLGLEAKPFTAIGKDYLGNEMKEFLSAKHISQEFIQVNAQPTGKVSVQLNAANEASYTIEAPSAWDFIQTDKSSLETLKALEPILIFGSLACRSEINRNTLMGLCSIASLRICDINLRAPHYNKELVDHLFKHSDWIKINSDELKQISSWYGGADLDESSQAQKIFETYGEVDLLLVTRGEKGAAYYDRENHYSHPGYKVSVKDTIGSGDSFLAMFLYKALQGDAPDDCLRNACAMGSVVATHTGATPSFQPNEEIRQLMLEQG